MGIHDVLADVPHIIAIIPVGSRRTCSPPPTDTDDDYLVFIEGAEPQRRKFIEAVEALGFEWDAGEAYDAPLGAENGFASFSRFPLNLIVTADQGFYTRFLAATHVAQRLNLMEKDDRRMLFQAVLYGVVE